MTVHKSTPLGQMHVPYNWTYADAAARTGASGFTADDVGKLARQLDNDTLWMLTDHTGPVWQTIGSSSGTEILADGSVPFAADQSMGGFNLTNLAAAAAAGEAVRYDEFNLLDGAVSTNSGDISTLGADLNVAEAAIATQYINGFEATGFLSDSTISYNEGTRAFSIAPTGASFAIWSNGTRYVKSGTIGATVPDTTGLHFIYFDASGTIQVATNPGIATVNTIIGRYCFVAIVYHDAATGKRALFGDERHGCVMDGDDHLHWHGTVGTVYNYGLLPTTFVADGDGSLAAHAQFAVQSGGITDEDLPHAIPARSSLDDWRVLYRSGSAGAWTYDTPLAPYPVLTTGSGRLAWNQFTGGFWQKTEVDSGDYVLAHIMATNDEDEPIMAVLGQATYATLQAARAGATTELYELSTEGLPMPEFRWICSVIYQTDNSYTNAVQARIVTTDEGDDYVDWRTSSPGTGSVAAITDHGALRGLDSPDHSVQAVYLPSVGEVTDCTDLGCALDVALSSGGLTGLAFTDNGDGTIDIAEGEALLRTGASDDAPIRICKIPATPVPLTLADESVNYVTVRYNSGAPNVRVLPSPPLALDEVIIYVAVRHGTVIHEVDVRGISQNTPTKNAIKDFAVYGYEHAKGGSITSEVGTRNIAVSSGIFYLGPVRIPHGSFDTSGADDFTYIYRDGSGGWTRVTGQTQINNTQYDDGSGTLATLSNNHYNVHWVYLCMNHPAQLHVLYGQDEYGTLVEAQAAGEPSDANRPPEAKDASTGELIAKIIVKKGVATFADIQVPWEDFLFSTDGLSPITTGYDEVTIKNEVASGTHGGSSTGGSWNTRPLNTLNNPKSYAWISFDDVNDRFTLQQGLYSIIVEGEVFGAGAHQVRLRADPAGAPSTAILGHGQHCPYFYEEASQTALLDDVISVGTATTYEVQHFIEQTVATYGLGRDTGSGEDQVYTTIRIARLGDS